MAENTSRGALPGFESDTMMSAAAAGMSPSRRQEVASCNFLPAERSLAPSQVSLNQGCPSQKADEVLAHHASSTENANFNWFHMLSFK